MFLKVSRHGRLNKKSPDPHQVPTPHSTALFTSERSNMDYFTIAGVCKRTGATESELAVFSLKENVDNALDFSEVNFPSSHNGNPEIFVDVKYSQELKCLILKTRNSSFGLINIGFTEKRVHAIFDDLDRFHSSKRNLFTISRGLQGDALKEVTGIHSVLGAKFNDESRWDEPIVIRNGAGEEFEVRAFVDKVKRRNYCTITKKTAAADNFTEVETHLPYNKDIVSLEQIKQVLVKYALLNTHITFHFNIVISVTKNKYWNVTLPATQKLFIKSNTTNKQFTSIYYYDLSTFENLIYSIEDKNLILYDILVGHFREGGLLKKEDDLLQPIGDLQCLPKEVSEKKIHDIFLRLRRTMGAPIDPAIVKRDLMPFSIKCREQAIFKRASQLGCNPKHIKYKTKVRYYHTYDNNHNLDINKNTTETLIPYIVEVAVIHTYNLPYCLLYCEGINAAPNHYHSFTDGYSLEWTTKVGTKKEAYGVDGLLKEYGYSFNGNGKPEKERSIILVNLWCPKIQYTDYGKAYIDLNPFYEDIVYLLSEICSIANKRRDAEGNKLEAKSLFTDYLVQRYKDVLKKSDLKGTDSWNTSTPVYRFRPMLERHGISVERRYLQGLVKSICDEMHELRLLPDGTFIQTGKIGVKREALGIYEAARAYIYFRGKTYDVSFKQLESIKTIATFILLIEKEGVAELLTYWADKYGFAICYTKGFLTDNAKEFSKLAAKEGCRLGLLTDDDFSGWAMSKEVPYLYRIGIRIETLEMINVPIGEVVEDLPKPKNSNAEKGYRASRHATTAERMYYQGMIPEKDWELLISGRYGRRIEIDNVIAYTGAERFWKEFILPSFQQLSKTANYNISLKKTDYLVPPNLRLLNELIEKVGRAAAKVEVQKIEQEYVDYDTATKGFIEDIEGIEKKIEKQIENKELGDDSLCILEKKLTPIIEQLRRKSETTASERKKKGNLREDDMNGDETEQLVNSCEVNDINQDIDGSDKARMWSSNSVF